MTDLALNVGGQTLTGWTQARVSASLDALCPGFEIAYADRWSDQRRLARIRPGQSCQLLWRGTVLLTGWVDAAETSESATEQSLRVTGRANTCDLVDCSVRRAEPWEGASLEQIARDVACDLGIEAVCDVSGEPFEYVEVEPGETCAELLGRLARARGCYLQTTSGGALWIVGAAKRRTKTRLERGKNILSATLTESHEQRYSEITVISQGASLEDAGPTGESVTVRDAGVTRHRPLVVVADAASDDLQARAGWERNVRIGRGLTLSVETTGWTCAEGAWQPNTLAHVVDDFLGIDDELAIVGVQLSLDVKDGTTAQLDLTDPRALELEPMTDEMLEGR